MRKLPLIALAFVAASIVTATAETYPSRPISIVVPFPAGGPTNTLGRVLADRMTRVLGQSVIIENLTGAAGTIGAAHVAHSAPDGYTLILGHWQTHVVNGATFALSFDVVNDFEPISLIADCPMGLFGRATLPPKNLAELIVWLKENPEKATVGIGGAGGGSGCRRNLLPKEYGHPVSVRALSWSSADIAGFAGGAHRLDLHSGGKRTGTTPCRSGPGLCRDGEEPMGGGAGYAFDRRKGWRPWTLRLVLAWLVGSAGHA